MRNILVVILFSPIVVNAQHFSQLSRFSIEYEKGCSPSTVIITQYEFLDKPRSFLFEEGGEYVSDTSHTYYEPGTYNIIQLIGEDISPKTDTLTFTIVESPIPLFEIYSCSGNEVEVMIDDNYYNFYRIYFTEDDSLDVISSSQNSRFQYPSQNASIIVKGLFNNSFNSSCGVASQTIQIESQLFSAKIDSVYLIPNCYNSYSASFQLSNTSSFKYQIEMEDNSEREVLYEGSIDSELIVEDLVIDSESERCFYLNTINPCDEVSVSSISYCIRPNLKELGQFYGSYASYSGSNILIDFGINTYENIKLERSSSLNEFVRLPDQTEGKTIDPVSANRAYQYRISYLELPCDTNSIVDLAPPHIQISSKGHFTNAITLNITESVNKLDNENQIALLFLYNSDSTSTIIEDFTGVFNLKPTLGDLQHIRIGYYYPTFDLTIYSNELRTRINYTIHVPKAFTPDNGDDLNDELQFFGFPTEEGLIQIYNRWGEIIYQSSEITLGWNGRTKEGKSPQGTYRYKVSYETPSGEIKSQVGTFVLIRK